MTESAAPVKKLSIKVLVKHLQKYNLPITGDDVVNPTCERILDIYWCLGCHIYGEFELLASMKSKDGSKRLMLSVVLRHLMDRLVPEFKPGFTIGDIIFPTKERTVVFFNAAMHFLKVLEEQSHIRENVMAEKKELERQEDDLCNAIADASERTRMARAKRDKSIQLCNKKKDVYLTLEAKNVRLAAEVDRVTQTVSEKKMVLLQEKNKEIELRSQIKKADERIEFLEKDILPPKEELYVKLGAVEIKVEGYHEQLEVAKRRATEFDRKLKQNETEKRTLSLLYDFTEQEGKRNEGVRLEQKLRESVEKSAQITEDLEFQLHQITVEKEDAERAHLEMLEAEKIGWAHLEYLQDGL